MKAKVLYSLMFIWVLLTGCSNQEEQNILQATSGNYTATLEIHPGIVGPNTYSVTIVDEDGEKQTAGEATLYFDMNMDHGKSDQPLELTEGIWRGEGPHLMMPGEWMLTLDWQDENGNSHKFEYVYQLKD